MLTVRWTSENAFRANGVNKTSCNHFVDKKTGLIAMVYDSLLTRQIWMRPKDALLKAYAVSRLV